MVSLTTIICNGGKNAIDYHIIGGSLEEIMQKRIFGEN